MSERVVRSVTPGGRVMDYVDVFISHQQRDKAKALALKDWIDKDLRFSCDIAENATTKVLRSAWHVVRSIPFRARQDRCGVPIVNQIRL